MISWLKNRLGWSTPQMPVFERALLAVRLGHGRSRCLAHKQGRCPGTDQCADCAWSEGWTRPFN